MATQKLSPALRARRLADQIQREMVDIFRQLRDPRLTELSVMSVVVSQDLSLAKLYVSSCRLGAVDRLAIETALNKASGFIRHALAQTLSIYGVPKLRFIYDDMVEKAIDLGQLIDQAVSSTARLDDESDRTE